MQLQVVDRQITQGIPGYAHFEPLKPRPPIASLVSTISTFDAAFRNSSDMTGNGATCPSTILMSTRLPMSWFRPRLRPARPSKVQTQR